MNSPQHPIWEAVKFLIIGGWVTACLWVTATQFDESELKAIGVIMAGVGVGKVAQFFRGSDQA